MAGKAVTVQVTGRVQGVWFRGWTQGRAQERGVAGWVMNEADGSVSAHLEGSADAVDGLLADLAQGPTAARVAQVVSAPAEILGLTRFEIRR